MKNMLRQLIDVLQRGECAALCTVLEASGSTPRGAGAAMAVFSGGSIAGTVGGGVLEYRAIRDGLRLLAGENVHIQEYRLDGGMLDMVCGGDIRALFRRLGREDLPWLEAALELVGQRTTAWLVTELTAPARTGIFDRGRGLRFLPGLDASAVEPLCRRRAQCRDGLFLMPLSRAGRVYVFGGGHVSQALVPALAAVDFSVIVLENRPEFARPELFPRAERVELMAFSELTERFPVTADDCLVVMTRGHRDDYEVLLRALATEAGYIGVIGSRRKAALTFEKLRQDGYGETALARVHTPIGLPIGAETPAEIAVSVAAELIQHRVEQ